LSILQFALVFNTAYMERLQVKFCARLVSLVRRGRALARLAETLEAGMYLAGCAYEMHDRGQPANQA
jgi:hypothetical protein